MTINENMIRGNLTEGLLGFAIIVFTLWAELTIVSIM
ncbi:hypothetical protein J2755_000437 [Methanohalophilus levihalophilus]|nr:hypothetical protein [Methanohalophilus levihalophilus]